MRGGISYEDALMLSYEERKLTKAIIDEHIETTKRTNLPFF